MSAAGASTRMVRRKPAPAWTEPIEERYPEPDSHDPFLPLSTLRQRAHSFVPLSRVSSSSTALSNSTEFGFSSYPSPDSPTPLQPFLPLRELQLTQHGTRPNPNRVGHRYASDNEVKHRAHPDRVAIAYARYEPDPYGLQDTPVSRTHCSPKGKFHYRQRSNSQPLPSLGSATSTKPFTSAWFSPGEARHDAMSIDSECVSLESGRAPPIVLNLSSEHARTRASMLLSGRASPTFSWDHVPSPDYTRAGSMDSTNLLAMAYRSGSPVVRCPPREDPATVKRPTLVAKSSSTSVLAAKSRYVPPAEWESTPSSGQLAVPTPFYSQEGRKASSTSQLSLPLRPKLTRGASSDSADGDYPSVEDILPQPPAEVDTSHASRTSKFVRMLLPKGSRMRLLGHGPASPANEQDLSSNRAAASPKSNTTTLSNAHRRRFASGAKSQQNLVALSTSSLSVASPSPPLRGKLSKTSISSPVPSSFVKSPSSSPVPMPTLSTWTEDSPTPTTSSFPPSLSMETPRSRAMSFSKHTDTPSPRSRNTSSPSITSPTSRKISSPVPGSLVLSPIPHGSPFMPHLGQWARTPSDGSLRESAMAARRRTITRLPIAGPPVVTSSWAPSVSSGTKSPSPIIVDNLSPSFPGPYSPSDTTTPTSPFPPTPVDTYSGLGFPGIGTDTSWPGHPYANVQEPFRYPQRESSLKCGDYEVKKEAMRGRHRASTLPISPLSSEVYVVPTRGVQYAGVPKSPQATMVSKPPAKLRRMSSATPVFGEAGSPTFPSSRTPPGLSTSATRASPSALTELGFGHSFAAQAATTRARTNGVVSRHTRTRSSSTPPVLPQTAPLALPTQAFRERSMSSHPMDVRVTTVNEDPERVPSPAKVRGPNPSPVSIDAFAYPDSEYSDATSRCGERTSMRSRASSTSGKFTRASMLSNSELRGRLNGLPSSGNGEPLKILTPSKRDGVIVYIDPTSSVSPEDQAIACIQSKKRRPRASFLHPSSARSHSMSRFSSKAAPPRTPTPVPALPFDEHLAPTKEQLAAAADHVVIAESGVRVRFGDLWAFQKTIVLFIRHFFCPLCQDYLFSLSRAADPEVLQQADVNLVIISNGGYQMIKAYRQIFRTPFAVYTDPTLNLYKAMGMTLRTLDGGPEVEKGNYVRHGLMGGMGMVVVNAIKVGMPVWVPGGEIDQLGGEFILGPGLTCSFAHRMRNTRSHVPILRVLKAAGIDTAVHLQLSTRPSTGSGRYQLTEEEEVALMNIRKLELEKLQERKFSRRSCGVGLGACDVEQDSIDEDDEGEGGSRGPASVTAELMSTASWSDTDEDHHRVPDSMLSSQSSLSSPSPNRARTSTLVLV